jgi:hypothetical protein
VRALLIGLVVLLVAAPAAAAQGEIDAAAEALRSGPVYVDRDAEAPLSASEQDDLRDRIAAADQPIYVAVLPAAAANEAGGSATETARRVAEAVGRNGTYAVVVGHMLRAGPSSEARQAAEDAAKAHQGESAAAVLNDFVDRAAGGGGSDGDGSDGGGAGAIVLLGLAGAGGAALLVARRRRRREEAAEFAEVKANARDDLVALGDDVRALDLDVQMPGLPDATRADYERAVNAYDRADAAWEQARSPQDLQAVGEALEEGRWAMESTRARLEGREPPERRPPCFFDPRHGPSSRDVEWAPPGGTPRMVPACEADAQRVERGEDPEPREVTVGGRRMPYWSAGPMYAPFMGGFFGGGLLPGLFIGSMFGDMWDGPGGGDWGGGDAGGGGDWGGGDFGGGDFGGGDF